MKTRSIITILVLMAVIAAHQTASADTPSTTTFPALDPAYLSEMPSIDRVKKDMKVDDAKMTIARQAWLSVILAINCVLFCNEPGFSL